MKQQNEIRFQLYKQNLKVVYNAAENTYDVWSYSTIVARIVDDTLYELGYWSITTQKHINFVCRQWKLKQVKHYNNKI